LKFSLYSLILFVFFSALICNAMLLWSKHQKLTESVAKLKSEIAVSESNLVANVEIESQYRDLVATVENLEHANPQILSRFNAHKEARYQITPEVDSFSILERPEIKEQSQRLFKTFLFNVPDSQSLAVHVDFKPHAYDETGSGDYVSTDSIQIQLPNGASKFSVVFSAKASEPSVQPKWFLKIILNGQEVLSREYAAEEPIEGYGSSNFPFEAQRNYSSEQKLPILMRFHPSGSKSIVQLNIVKSELGEQ